MSTAEAQEFAPLEVTAAPARAELRLVAESDELTAARAESRASLGQLAELLGYPTEWGSQLEADAFARGVVWRIVESA
jgi:hypothetical protein